jgi:hypothetical protein
MRDVDSVTEEQLSATFKDWSPVYKRLVVCRETQEDDRSGALIWPIDFIERHQRWEPSWAARWQPYGSGVVRLKGEARERKSAEDGFEWPADSVTIEGGFVFLGEIGKAAQDSLGPKARLGMEVDTSDESVAVIQMCAALACQNVKHEALEPPPALVKRAAKEGARPFFTYHVLTVDAQRETAPRVDHGGTHSPPRTHVRRGHIRHLDEQRFVWVRSALVNPGQLGAVGKSYAVRRKEDS